MNIDDLVTTDDVNPRYKRGIVVSILAMFLVTLIFYAVNLAVQFDLSHNFIKSNFEYYSFIFTPYLIIVGLLIVSLIAAFRNKRKLCNWIAFPIIIPIVLLLLLWTGIIILDS